MRTFLTSIFILLVTAGAMAQAAKLKQARQKMDNLDYIGAIELYNQILQNSDAAEAKINLAEAYRKVNDTPNAEFWYGQVVRLPQAEPIHKLYYGQMLQRNGKCDLAKVWYQQFVDLQPEDQRGQYLVRACDYEEELMTRSAGVFEVKNAADINTYSDDFSPQFYKAGLVFSSERDTNPAIRRIHTWTGNPFLELYYVDLRQSRQKEVEVGDWIYGRTEKFSNQINSKFHDATVSFSKNGEEIFFTRNNFLDGQKGKDDEGVIRLKVFYARGQGEGRWGELQSLPFNSNEYSVAHPALSIDGNKLYFASDMPGGFGGMDLYVSAKESGRWGPPINLGPEINTEGHEIFPSIGHDGKLYFSSDGQIGLGGLDIYFVTDKGNRSWSAPENMGFPINSKDDDFGIVFNKEGTAGFFSSDRMGGVGRDDIYSFKRNAIPVEVLVYDERTGNPLPGATVNVVCKNKSMITNQDGIVTIDMKLDECCNFKASLAEYEPNTAEGCTKNLTLSDKMLLRIPLMRSAEFEVEGIVYDAGTGLPLEGALVSIENTCGQKIAEPIVTLDNGKYYFKLDKECCYKIKATKNGYFAGIADNVCTKGLTTSTTFKENLYLQPTSLIAGGDKKPGAKLEETPYTYLDPALGLWVDKKKRLPADGIYPDGKIYEKGMLKKGGPGFDRGPIDPTADNPEITYLLHIYYDFDQAYVRDDAITELNKLYTLMVENPQYIIEIGSHTDARGSNHYNHRLSQRRAESVVRWLVDKGIGKDRLVPRGYGETKNVNDCTNNVPCSEKQHQLNRRTEFKVIGCKDCVDPEKTAISKENPNVRVDPCKSCPF